MGDNAVFEKYLLPRLDSYREFLEKNGVRAEMSMDVDEIPGLMVFTGGAENFFVTFMEGDLEAPEVMRITAGHVDSSGEKYEALSGNKTGEDGVDPDIDEGVSNSGIDEDGVDPGIKISPEDIVYKSLLVDASQVEDVETLMRFGKIALSERCMEPYPTREMVEEADSYEDDLTFGGDAEFGEMLASEDDDADLGELSYNASASLMPRIGALMRSYIACGVEDAEAVYAKIPYIILVDGDVTFISAYEEIGDNEYLLHFRADVPFGEGEDMEEIREQIRTFNEEHFFVRCSIGFEDLGIYEEESENVITFFACTPDIGGMKDDAVYGFFAALFETEFEEFFA